MVDSNTLNVITVLAVDIAGAIVIFIGFICLRGLRGDKKVVRSSFNNKMVTEIVFEESHMEGRSDDHSSSSYRVNESGA